MALYHKWDVKNDFAYVLQFFSHIYDSLGSVDKLILWNIIIEGCPDGHNLNHVQTKHPTENFISLIYV